MGPAETLRAAAAKVRETGAKATPGPWTAQEVPDEVYVEIMAGTEVAVAHAVCEHPAAPGAAADAEWIALMSPALAGPLASRLDAAADAYELLTTQYGISPEDAVAGVSASLAMARAILGEVTP
jgi:hypothetical protein